jgi:hypothetical protein
MAKARTKIPREAELHLDAEMAESRLPMVRPVKQMSVERRLELFERLSRDAAWILSSAKRIR